MTDDPREEQPTQGEVVLEAEVIYEDPADEEGSREIAPSEIVVGGTQEEPGDALRMVSIGNFDAPSHLTEEEAELSRRRFTTFFVDEDRSRQGGNSTIMHGTNVWGEAFALKVFDRVGEGEEGNVGRFELFKREYGAHQRVSGLKGFPKLYGSGTLNGVPVIIMEWIEGQTLESARMRLAADDEGRLSPLTVARLGRDLFDILAHMDVLSEKVVHGDLSTSNIMVDTSRLSLADQVEEGRFELVIMDFGSASASPEGGAPGSVSPLVVGASPGFAAPEILDIMAVLTSDPITEEGRGEAGSSRIKVSRPSPAADVYAAASALYLLLSGSVPYEAKGIDFADLADSKRAMPPLQRVGLHASAPSISHALLHESEVAVAVAQILGRISGDADADEAQEALALVDDDLEAIIISCLDPDPFNRLAASEAFAQLSLFCSQYKDNMEHSFNGEELVSSKPSLFRQRLDSLNDQTKVAIRRAAKAATGVLGGISIYLASTLSAGAQALLAFGQAEGNGTLSGLVVAILLLLVYGTAALAQRLRGTANARLMRSSCVVAVVMMVYGLLIMSADFNPSTVKMMLFWAVVFNGAIAWCWSVLDFCLIVKSPVVRKGLGSGVVRTPLLLSMGRMQPNGGRKAPKVPLSLEEADAVEES